MIPYPYTLQHSQEWISSVADDVERNGRETLWAVRESSGCMIGAVELSPGGHGRMHCAEIGYWLAKPWWSRGIMAKVVGCAVERGIKEFVNQYSATESPQP